MAAFCFAGVEQRCYGCKSICTKFTVENHVVTFHRVTLCCVVVLCLPPHIGSGRVNPLVIFRLIDALIGRQSKLRDAYRHLSLTPSPGELGPLLLMQLAGICGRPVYPLHDPALQLFACCRCWVRLPCLINLSPSSVRRMPAVPYPRKGW